MKVLKWVAYTYLSCHAFVAIAQDSGESLVEKLSELSELYDNGFLADEEFLSSKNQLLTESENILENSSNRIDLNNDSSSPVAEQNGASANIESSNRTAGYGVVTRGSRLEVHGITDTKPLTAQLIVQGNLVKIDALSTSERLLTGALGAASTLVSGVDLSGIVTKIAKDSFVDEANYKYLPMNEVVTREIIRVAECSLIERNREIKSVHLVPSNVAYNSPDGFSGYTDIRNYWRDYIELDDSWKIEEEIDEVIWLSYSLIVEDEFEETNVNELPIIGASGFMMTISSESGTTVEQATNVHTDNLRSKKAVFGKFLNELVPKYQPELPHPDCGSKSEIYLKLKNEISEETELSDLESFFEDLGIRYERDRSKRSLLGVLKTEERSDRVEYPVRIELFHSRRPRTFERASIRYMID
ncbi:hypothetical protein N8076_01790 [Gammaproteobacteria bacterium]|nr:hypothetical protein [Gammaproteobacteria bacterium]